MAPGTGEKASSHQGSSSSASRPDKPKPEKSYFSSAVDSINPWAGSRSSTPTPKDPAPGPAAPAAGAAALVPPPPAPPANPNDHSTSYLYGQSLRKYPAGCPPLKLQWFHAVDIPKRKPQYIKGRKTAEDAKPPAPPKKYVAFSAHDSRSIEAAYQRTLEELEDERTAGAGSAPKRKRVVSIGSSPGQDAAGEEDDRAAGAKVPVNEDFLFDVDIEQRELAPVYWMGPVYDVRRGSWFYQEGSTLRPCEENLAAQLEEGYLKVRPWLYPARSRSNSSAKDLAPKAAVDDLKFASGSAAQQGEPSSAAAVAAAVAAAGGKASKPPPEQHQHQPQHQQPQHQPQAYRLFGTYMNSIATYQDSTTAWLSSDSMLSWVTSTMYERFAGGGYMSGVKLVRGYSEPKKADNKAAATAKDEKPTVSTPTASTFPSEAADEQERRRLKRRSAPPSTRAEAAEERTSAGSRGEPSHVQSKGLQLRRELSSMMDTAESRDPMQEEEAIRQREEEEIQADYNALVGETQGRDIEHLVLVTHGIGQLLGLRMESVNFVHDVNVLRKTMKSVYSTSADLQALNSELGEGPGNCRVQVLPVCWRHLLDFPKRREKKSEHDLGEVAAEEDEYPSLEDITIEGVAFARSLISDLALDVLLYQSAYREQISEIVLRESNRIFRLFRERNPGFKGKVHIMGHSLGSAVMFDILCRQREKARGPEPKNPLRFWPAQDRPEPPRDKDPRDLSFEFHVDDFFCLGSPVGLFQMLKGRTIAARHLPHAAPSASPLSPDYLEGPLLGASTLGGVSGGPDERVSPITGLPFSISSPKVSQLFNIFHPSDPISYRLEPLISPAMSTLKPQALPYTKKGIFGSVAPQGLTGIGAKVGQSVSGLWSSLSAGITSNLLNRSLGLTHEDVAKITASSSNQQQQEEQRSPSPGAGTNISAGGVISDASALGEKTAERQRQLADTAAVRRRTTSSGNEVTLIDDELETLCSRFEKRRVDEAAATKEGKDGGVEGTARASRESWAEEETKAQRLRKEEMKVRALNRNGRVDYSIQESVLDFNPINTIASHMSYWADEDVNHFVMSQLLSNRSGSERR